MRPLPFIVALLVTFSSVLGARTGPYESIEAFGEDLTPIYLEESEATLAATSADTSIERASVDVIVESTTSIIDEPTEHPSAKPYTFEEAVQRLAEINRKLRDARRVVALLEGGSPSLYAETSTSFQEEPTDAPEANIKTTETDAESELQAAKRRVAEAQEKVDRAQQVVDYLHLPSIVAPPSTTTPDSPAVRTAVNTDIKVPLCRCYEADECRLQAEQSMGRCMQLCGWHLQYFGDDNADVNVNCFLKNNASIIEADRCLFRDQFEYCNLGFFPRFVKPTNWTDLGSIEYSSRPDKSIENGIWKQYEPQYNAIQQFAHCTKQCMHKEIDECTLSKGCAVNMPDRDDLDFAMRQCTKNNYMIANALFSACRCIYVEAGVKELREACRIIGNQYYIDRA